MYHDIVGGIFLLTLAATWVIAGVWAMFASQRGPRKAIVQAIVGGLQMAATIGVLPLSMGICFFVASIVFGSIREALWEEEDLPFPVFIAWMTTGIQWTMWKIVEWPSVFVRYLERNAQKESS